jgi:putative Holliday junction resolvase
LCLSQLLDPEVAVNLPRTQIPNERSGLADQPLGFTFESLDARSDAPSATVSGRGRRCGGRRHAGGFLRYRGKGQQRETRKTEQKSTCHPEWVVRGLYGVGRVMGLDLGDRRIGVAVSDVSATLARPLGVLHVRGLERDGFDRVVAEMTRLAEEEDGLTELVIGLPRRLDGSSNQMTPRVEAFAARLGPLVRIPIRLQDERLSSREAEERLALREKDWRVRRKKLDGAAAAVILQDYLDRSPVTPS